MAHRILESRGRPPDAGVDDPREAVGRAAAGSGAVVLLEAEAASAGLDAVASLAQRAGLDVLFARARREERAARFGVAMQLLRPAFERLDEGDRAQALEGGAELAAPLLRGGSPNPASELAVMHGLYWLVSNLADRAPLALLVEDAQWADEPSLRLFAYLAQRIEELPVALVVAEAT